jgi:hypothetical protein
MDYLTTYSNIAYTPAWYYKQFPGFYSIDSYKILAAWTGGCRTPNSTSKTWNRSSFKKITIVSGRGTKIRTISNT